MVAVELVGAGHGHGAEVNNAHLTLLDPEKRAQVIAIIDEATKHAEKEHKKHVRTAGGGELWVLCYGRTKSCPSTVWIWK